MRYVALLAAILIATPVTAQFTSVRVHVIDVGQADGILIRTPTEEWIPIDAGEGSLPANSLATQRSGQLASPATFRDMEVKVVRDGFLAVLALGAFAPTPTKQPSPEEPSWRSPKCRSSTWTGGESGLIKRFSSAAAGSWRSVPPPP